MIILFTINTIPTKFNTLENKIREELTRFTNETPQLSYETTWTPNGTAICTSNLNQDDPQIISDGMGGAIITWFDGRSGNYDIYIQRVNSSGNTQWTANGTAICTEINDQEYPQIVSDGAGGAIITWTDYRSGIYPDIYAQKINSSGIPQWTANGTAICMLANTQRTPVIMSDGAGGAIIAWLDWRGGDSDVYAQWVNASGIFQWTVNGIAICSPVNNQEGLQVISDGAGGYIFIWQDWRSGYNNDMYAQRINASGIPQWVNNGIVISNASNNQQNAQMISDGAGGAIITWIDGRNGGGINIDIYAQRINSSGIPQWTTNGIAICNMINQQFFPQIISDGKGGAIISWVDGRSVDGSDIYAQQINSSGSTQWIDNGTAICTAIDDQARSQIISDGAGGAIITWEDQRNGNYDVYAQRIDSNGIPQWIDNGTVICNEINTQQYLEITSDGAGGAFITWEDFRSLNYDIYAQRIKNDIPTSNHPEPIDLFIDGSETINWTLYDDCGEGEYRVVANNTAGSFYTWINWTPWVNNTPFYIPINSTELGVYNYTIEYYDDQFQHGIPDTVIVTIVDIYPPDLVVQVPLNNTYWAEPPLIKVSAIDVKLDKIWYNISGIPINEFLQNNTAEYLNDTIWDNIPQGMFEMNFYANDSSGNLNVTFTYTLYKDTYAPNVIIQIPVNNTYWDEKPLLSVSVIDAYLDKIWYTVSNNPAKEFLQNNTAEYLNNIFWSNLPHGPFELYFYANDSAGNIGNLNLSLNKHVGMWVLSPFIIDNSGEGDYTWLEASIQGWCKGSGTSIDPYTIENIIIDGQNYGSCLAIKNSNEYIVIKNSIFTNSGDGMTDAGIGLFTSNHVELLSNNCSNNNAYGIYLSNCQEVLIEGCTINSNAKSGIMLYESNNNIIRNNTNTINLNIEYGIYLSASHYNEISTNVINYNSVGIYFYESNYNTITNNDLQFNSNRAVVQKGCTGNLFTGNNPPIGKGNAQFPFEMLILIIIIGAIVALGIAGALILKKKIFIHKKGKKEKKTAFISKTKKLKGYNVFLSYSTKDSEYFQLSKIVKNLKKYPEIGKVLYWEVDSGENIVEYMERTLKLCNVFILFCSENALNSQAVTDEWQAAFQLRKKGQLKIVPVYEDESHIPALLTPLLNVKFSKGDFNDFIIKLYQGILRE